MGHVIGRVLAAFVLAIGFAAPVVADTLVKAKIFYARGNYAKAAELLLPLAEQNNADAQNRLGYMYLEGLGMRQDHAEALTWFQLAAEQGQAAAQYNLGQMYDAGKGVHEDDAEAVKWYRLAARQGLAIAQNDLGHMYLGGTGVPEDAERAAGWFRLAADQYFIPAQYNLASMYAGGHGLQQDDVQALKWLDLAASWATGKERDRVLKFRNTLAARMTPGQIATAERLEWEWRRKRIKDRAQNQGSAADPGPSKR